MPARRPDRLAGARLAAMARAAARRHLRREGPPAAWPEGGPQAALEDRQTGPRLVVADHRRRAALHHRRRGRRPGHLRLRPGRQARCGRPTTAARGPAPIPGARACCAYSEGKLYHMNAHGRVACLDAATGKELWAVDVLERFQAQNITWAISECLLVDGPRVIVTPGGPEGPHGRPGQAQRPHRSGPPSRSPRTGPRTPRRSSSAMPGRRIVANCSSAHGFGVDADTRQAALDRAAAEPVRRQRRHARLRRRQDLLRHRLRLRNLLPACGRQRPGPGRRRPGARPSIPAPAAVLLVDGLLYGSGYQKHKSWLCLDWKSGEVRYEYKGLTTGAAVYCRRAAVLPGRGRPGGPVAAHARAVRARRPVPPRARKGPRRLGVSGPAPRPALPALPR